MTKPIQNRAKNTRETILTTAYDLFITHGYHAVFIRDIAQKAGISVGSIYRYFPDQKHILLTLLDERLPLSLAVSSDRLQSTDLRSIITSIVENRQKNSANAGLRAVLTVVAMDDADVKARLDARHEASIRELSLLLAKLEKKGLSRPHLDLAFTSNLLHILVTNTITPTTTSAEINQLVDVILHIIVPDHAG
ncbi:TetR/AcrR family transcriptional regulator [Lactococcus insecticola]|uniref:HTH tetR-type domain-containing protein n=1 Tax=Pseudolactococcus insecticola TaxID=2709158 RepID=A0A6A0B3M2_9LACT|nr:TetR/AcrR family transcriptional regulator [Lactococcus insecticola]GFH39752.1 hypothetical protein Hs20B_01500 [Lactococcus insecticola]